MMKLANKRHSIQRQSGVALLTVLLILSLMVILAANMTSRLQLEMRRTTNLATFTQAKWYAFSGEEFVKKVIQQDLKDSPNVVHLSQYWATKGSAYPLNDGVIGGEVKDLQSCFNLNALSQPNDKKDGQRPLPAKQFMALLELLEIEPYLAEQITDSVRDWIDADTVLVSSVGAEDAHYESLSPAYLPANGPMGHGSEFRVINGVTAEIYKKVRPYICAIPESEMKINVNTIESEQAALLAAIFTPNLSLEDAQSVIGDRDDEGYKNVEAILAHSALSGIDIKKTGIKETLAVISNYFLLDMKADFGEAQFRVETLFKRQDKTTNLSAIRRQYGGPL